MSKKTAKPEPTTGSNNAAAGTEAGATITGADVGASIDLSAPTIQKAIAEGRSLIGAGKSKADAARAIYAVIRTEPKEVIVAAFVEGATLTPKGALTYWYNCERKAAKATQQA